MLKGRAQARRRLDERFARLRPFAAEPPPHRGWVRAIRDALGMSRRELAERMGSSQATVADIERNEALGTVQLDTLRRAAEAMDCQVVYALIPTSSLDVMVANQARRKAAAHLRSVGHQGRLEDQELDEVMANRDLEAFASDLVDRRGLWSEEQR